MIADGTFEVQMTGEPPYEVVDGISLSRASFDKRFSGPLNGTSKVQMLAARTKVPNSAGYVALERIVGELEGRSGSFVVVHLGLMNQGAQSLTIHIVPDSGTGALVGIAGKMTIRIEGGQHYYGLEYAFPE
ncbi:MAG: DUF3224 domain-containing protein [Deltaproteobacteria bacterium]|jgi:hypothetical protein|nr:DUF3224 domain-containing protein [Deltaproteobacteria bacterium]